MTAALEAVSVACRVVLDPTVTFPKLRVAGLIASWGLDLAVPVPLNCSTVGEFFALLTKVAFPETVPVALGANWMVTAALLPAAIVRGSFVPTMENSEFDNWSEEMVTAAFEALKVACLVTLDPTATLPKLRVAGLTASCGFAVAVPVPLSCSTVGEFVALLAKVALPETAPALVGVNCIDALTVVPAGMVAGNFSPTMANSEFDDWSEVIVTGAFEAVSEACIVAFDPTDTFPKLRVEGEIASCGLEFAPPVPETFSESGESGAVLRRLITPVFWPCKVGVKITSSCALDPKVRFKGKATLPIEKAEPCIEPESIVSVSFPVFVSWIYVDFDSPTFTWLKTKLQGLQESFCAHEDTGARQQSSVATTAGGK